MGPEGGAPKLFFGGVNFSGTWGDGGYKGQIMLKLQKLQDFAGGGGGQHYINFPPEGAGFSAGWGGSPHGQVWFLVFEVCHL